MTNLYFQFLTHEQTRDMARLLAIPTELFFKQIGCQLKVSAQGLIRKRKFDYVDEAVEYVAANNFNQLEIRYNVTTVSENAFTNYGISSIVGLFTPAASCELWSRIDDWPASRDRSARIRRMNAKAAELDFSFYRTPRPSIYEMVVQLNSTPLQDVLLDSMADTIGSHLKESIKNLKMFGCVDAGGEDFFVKLESNVLMTARIRILARVLPANYQLLGQQFDGLHPIIFGAKDVCLGMKATLGEHAKLIPSNVEDFAVLRLKGDPQSLNLVSDWIIPEPKRC